MDTIAEYYDITFQDTIYDSKKDIFHSLGGCRLDDRLGIAAIIQIIEDGYLPHIIFTTDEEIGGLGASKLTKNYLTCPLDAKFIIELDRQGKDDAVYYECRDKKFHKYINSFGFKTKKGTFSDCLLIGEQWNLPYVNLSCGYIDEHTPYEIGHLRWTERTIEKVEMILDDNDN
jgi:hypothetical protein